MLHPWIATALVGATLFAISSLSFAQGDDVAAERRHKACLALMDEQGTAADAGDSEAAIRLAQRLIRECKTGTSRLDAIGHSRLALAHLGKGEHSKAAKAAAQCIQIYFSNEQCHLTRVEALFGGGRIEEGKAALRIAKRVARRSVEVAQESLQGEPDQFSELKLKNARHTEGVLYMYGIKYQVE